MNEPIYEIDIRELREKYDSGDLSMLEYLKSYISGDLMDLYQDVMNYNEIYANNWTIKDLFDMGKEDNYWTNRANFFIEKYNVPKEDYDEFSKFFDKYIELRDSLLDEMGLSDYLDQDLSIEEIPPSGFIESEIITQPEEINEEDSYTIARVMNFGNCAELHYSKGEATIEYGYKMSYDCWEDEIEEIDWFNKNMCGDEVCSKLYECFTKYFSIEKSYKDVILEVSKEYDVDFESEVPFENFDAGNNYNMSSFSDYYNDIFKKLHINFNSVFAEEVSDGKYTLTLDGNILDIRAWDKLEDVIDNIETALAFYKNRNKEKGDSVIEIETNNKGTLRLSQTEADKARCGIAVESVDEKGKVYRRDLISEGDFVMLMNYYRYVVDNDIKDDFINPNGLSERDKIDEDVYGIGN